MLTGCTLYLERLLQKLFGWAGGSLSKVAHCTLGEMVSALHHTAVVPPVKVSETCFAQFSDQSCTVNRLSILILTLESICNGVASVFIQDNVAVIIPLPHLPIVKSVIFQFKYVQKDLFSLLYSVLFDADTKSEVRFFSVAPSF